jgi:hypothetical protein
MRQIQISRMTEAGKAAFRSLIESMSIVEDVSERVAPAFALISNPRFCEPVPGAGSIDLDARFATSLDFAQHVYPAMLAAGPSTLVDPGINLFLYLAYADQLLQKRARVIANYFLDDRTPEKEGNGKAYLRNMRNTIYVHLTFYHFHHKNHRICSSLLSGRPCILANHEERISQRPQIVSSPGAIELVLAMFYNPKTGNLHRSPSAGRDPRSRVKDPNSALKELSVIVFGQCARNYDLSRMTAQQMFALVPDTKGLKPYKQHALRWFSADVAEH